MLVKVGEIWVRPNSVIAVDSIPASGTRIFTDHHSLWIGKITSDACAKILNGSLQSFGGDVNESETDKPES